MIKWEKGIAGVLVVSMIAWLAACNKEMNSDNTDQGIQGTTISTDDTSRQEQVDLSYQSKFTTFTSKEDGISCVRIEEDKIYEISFGAETVGTLYEQPFTANGVADRKVLMEFEARGSMGPFYVDGTGNLYMVSSISENANDKGASGDMDVYFVRKFDAEGNQLYDQQIKPGDEERFSPVSLVVDGKGRAYVGSMNCVLSFDEEGMQKGCFQVSKGYVNGITVNQDDNLYCAVVYYEGDDGCELFEYAFGSTDPIHKYKNFINVQGGEIICKEDVIHALSSDSICTYSLKDEKIINRITLLNCGIDVLYVESFGMIGEEYYLAIKEGEYGTWSRTIQAKEYELACVGKADASQVQEKQVITFGAPMVGTMMQERIIEMNKKSDKYRVVVKTYYSEAEGFKEGGFEEAIERFQMDVMTGKGPDIIDLRFLNPGPLFEKGVMEDLYPWLEKSSRVSKDFFVDGILDKMSYHGKLYAIQDGFSLDTMIGKTNIVGNKSGWTISDLLATAKAHPGMDLLDGYTKTMFLEAMLSINADQYVDFSAKACHFDSEEFKAVLELANSLEDEIDYGGLENDSVDRMYGEKTMLYFFRISTFNDYATLEALFGEEEFTNIGYPSGKGNGCLILGSGGVGISALSAHKEAAWAFMEDYIELLDEEQYSYAFPVTRGKYEREEEFASEVHYLTDENGELILDDRGNPIKRSGGPAAIMDGMILDPDPLTGQQAKKLANLIKDGISVYEMMDDEIYRIIEEEAQAYFTGAKSVDEVADVIQKRVSLYVMEN